MPRWILLGIRRRLKVQPGASIPFSSSRTGVIALLDHGPSPYRCHNDRDAPSIEQCVFFDRLISLAYEYRNGDAGRCDMAMDVTLRQLRAYVAVLESASF